MAFYLEKAIFVNRAPFEHLELDFKGKGINVLTAVNGKGKTTILTYIVDAFYELAKKHYHNEFENKTNKYYRISSALYNIQMNTPSFVYLRFRNNDKCWDYLDIKNNCSQEEYDKAIIIENKIPYHEFGQSLKENQNIKFWSQLANDKKGVLTVFDTNVITSFPSYRYEVPSYLNTPYAFSFEHKRTLAFTGHLTNPIEVITGISEISNWILDVLLDLKSNEQRILLPAERGYINQLIPAKENTLWENLNTVLAKSLSSKKYKGIIRFGIGDRNGGATRISVINDIDHSHSVFVSPSIFNLSSGELALVSLFGEILRQSDNLHNNIPLSDIQGLVLVDEIDKHLHITLQKEVLPKLMMMFPNIQFIVSSHSPFLNMGLADEATERTQIIDLDNNGFICEPTNNDLYKEVYEMMINENQRFYDNFKQLQNELNELNMPVVITEGKTDIIHILKAKEKLGVEIDFKTIPIANQPDGDSNLEKMLEQLCKVKQSNKIIAIFDRDVPKIVQAMDDNGVGLKSYGNNVYGFCISAPQSRIDNGQNDISIEYLYSDDEIHTTLPNGCKLFFGDEFYETSGRHRENKDLVLKNQSDRGKPKIVENNGGQAVYDLNDNNVLAKKIDFANAINEDLIQISQESWDNFRHIFEKIDTIINLGE